MKRCALMCPEKTLWSLSTGGPFFDLHLESTGWPVLLGGAGGRVEPEARTRKRTARLGSVVNPLASNGLSMVYCGGRAWEGREPRTEAGQLTSAGPALCTEGCETGNKPAALILVPSLGHERLEDRIDSRVF